MTERARVEVKGAEEFSRTLHNAADDLGDLDRAQESSGRLVLQRAQGRTPKVTGALAGSLYVESEVATVAVASDLVYAPVIHFGWAARNIAPNPYLFTAAEDSMPVVLGFYADDAQRALNQVRGA